MDGRGIFDDREAAGRRLAARLGAYAGAETVVLALPRGGVPVGHEVARHLGVPLDVLVVRKLGVPGYEELAMGAVAGGGVSVVEDAALRDLGISPEALDRVARRELAEVNRRERAYRAGRPAPEVADRTVILVDDGIATGSTMRAAISAVRSLHPAAVVVAAPVAPPSAVRELKRYADDVVCVATPEPFSAVGTWYRNFPQVSDEQVTQILARPTLHRARPATPFA